MNRRSIGFVLVGIMVLLIFVFLGRYALRETPPEPTTAQTEPVRPEPLRRARPASHPAELPAETPVKQPEDLAATNAAALYRQAFALYDALSKDEKGVLGDWRTNVDALVEAELCDKIRPICDLMHRAISVTNCDWGIEPLMYDSKLPHLSPARGIARAAVWNAAHCRANETAAATDDVLSALRVGQQISKSALIGYLVDLAIQSIARSYVGTNLGSFRGAEGQRLSAAFSDPAYEEEPSLAMEQEARVHDRLVSKLASMPADELEKKMPELQQLFGLDPGLNADRATILGNLQQVVDSQRDLAVALASGSWDKYEAWMQRRNELEDSNPLVKAFLGAYDNFLNRVEREAVQREMTVTALAVARDGPSALPSHPDPSTGQPFIYAETADGFELQSGYQTNGVPLKMQFK
jgi:hypothetical protein